MVVGADDMKKLLKRKNEANGPVFKMKNDPRYTRIGKMLARFAIDELPQFINVLKGDMSLVGPRPLPVDEAKRIPDMYNLRFSVLPGMASSWIVYGAHSLSFHEWMKHDREDVLNKSVLYDVIILIKIVILLFRFKTFL
jgi:lipopolysaccharide/colanic/teichoic acid biosynthesis glycosyltransferase